MWVVTSQKNGVSAPGLQRVLGLGHHDLGRHELGLEIGLAEPLAFIGQEQAEAPEIGGLAFVPRRVFGVDGHAGEMALTILGADRAKAPPTRAASDGIG